MSPLDACWGVAPTAARPVRTTTNELVNATSAETTPAVRGWAREGCDTGSDVREHLPRVEDAARVQGLLHRALRPAGTFVQLLRQPAALEVAHPVLAGDRPAQVQADLHDLLEDALCGRGLLLVLRIEEHGRVRVAVAGVRDERDRQRR